MNGEGNPPFGYGRHTPRREQHAVFHLFHIMFDLFHHVCQA